MKAIKAVGGATAVQDESSLIFGMPKAVMDAGYADEVLPITEMAGSLLASVEAKGRVSAGTTREQ